MVYLAGGRHKQEISFQSKVVVVVGGAGADLGALSTNHSQQGLECQCQSQSWKFQREGAEVTARCGRSEGEGRCVLSCTGIPQQLQLSSPYCVILKLDSYIPIFFQNSWDRRDLLNAELLRRDPEKKNVPLL